MAVHKHVIEWHDLMEDPKDLPTQEDLCVVMAWDPDPTSKDEHWVFCIPSDCTAMYDAERKTWRLGEIDADFYGLEEIGVDTVPAKAVAWAYAFESYIPEEINQLHIKKFGQPIREVMKEE